MNNSGNLNRVRGTMLWLFSLISILGDGIKDTKSTNDQVVELRVQLESKLPEVRIRAAIDLGIIGPAAASASRDLCKTLVDRNADVRQAASESLESVNPVLRELVLPIAVDQNVNLRIKYLKKIRESGAIGKLAIPVVQFRLTQLARILDSGEALECLTTLVAIGNDESDVHKVTLALANRRQFPSMSKLAVSLLPALKVADHTKDVELLKSLLSAEDAEMVLISLGALGRLGRHSFPALDPIRKLKGHSLTSIRIAADHALAAIDSDLTNFTRSQKAGASPQNSRQKSSATVETPASVTFLSDLQEKSKSYWEYVPGFGFGKGGKLVTGRGKESRIILAKKDYPQGIFAHPRSNGMSSVIYEIKAGEFTKFCSDVGVADERAHGPYTPLIFEVVFNEEVAWTSKPVKQWGQMQACEIPIPKDVIKVELRCRCPGDASFAYAVWGDPRFLSLPK